MKETIHIFLQTTIRDINQESSYERYAVYIFNPKGRMTTDFS